MNLEHIKSLQWTCDSCGAWFSGQEQAFRHHQKTLWLGAHGHLPADERPLPHHDELYCPNHQEPVLLMNHITHERQTPYEALEAEILASVITQVGGLMDTLEEQLTKCRENDWSNR